MKFKTQKTGFTIPELLVVVFIIVLFSALIVPNWQASQNSLALQRSATKVSQDIERTRERALRVQRSSCISGNIAGYGIYFTPALKTSYKIFTYCNLGNKYSESTDAIVETNFLENGIAISGLSGDISIVFIPPVPNVWINGTQTQTATITLGSITGSAVKSIVVNSNGIVSIQ